MSFYFKTKRVTSIWKFLLIWFSVTYLPKALVLKVLKMETRLWKDYTALPKSILQKTKRQDNLSKSQSFKIKVWKDITIFCRDCSNSTKFQNAIIPITKARAPMQKMPNSGTVVLKMWSRNSPLGRSTR